MSKTILVPLLTVLFSVLAYVLRAHEINTLKDSETLLYQSGMASYLFFGMLLLAFVVLGFLLFIGSRSLPNYEYMVYSPNIIFPVTVAIGSGLLFLSFFVGILDLKYAVEHMELSLFSVVLRVMKCMIVSLGGLAGLVMMKVAYRGECLDTNFSIIVFATPSIFLMIDTYQQVATEPNLQDRLIPVLSGLALLYSCYFLAASSARRPAQGLFMWMSMVSFVFFSASMVENESLYYFLSGFGYRLSVGAFAVSTLSNAFCSIEEYRSPPYVFETL